MSETERGVQVERRKNETLERAIGRTVCNVREGKHLTTTELANLVGISQAQISRLENGRQGFRSGTLARIARELGVELVVAYG